MSAGNRKADQGQGLAEYSLILLLVSLFLIAALRAFGLSLQSVFEEFTERLP